ncbi:MAG: hypothetical protein HC859_01910 [Bacteroidia bacterium]|nr:hypothetical protein [Bacteroidia bacterium]
MINGIELEGLEQIETFKPFEYSDNIFFNPITLVNNSVINIGNGFIGTRNSLESSYCSSTRTAGVRGINPYAFSE